MAVAKKTGLMRYEPSFMFPFTVVYRQMKDYQYLL